jgi:two-component sensor histidine kinase
MRAYGYGTDEFDLSINIEKEFLDVDTVMPLGLLVNEIITNSFKYAYHDVTRPLLKIHLTNGDQQLKLEVRDNGPGLQTVANGGSSSGFGKKLIDALSKQLKATYSVNSSGGTVYQFTIPNKDKVA